MKFSLKFRPIVSYAIASIVVAFALFYLAPVRGEINKFTPYKVKLLSFFKLPILIDSYGGSNKYALEASKTIYNNKMDIFIYGECSSACAEYLLVSARKIYFSGNAMIGFHNSDFAVMDIEGTDLINNYCAYSRYLWLRKIYREKRLNPKFNRVVKDKIQLTYLPEKPFNSSNMCLDIFHYSKFRMWYPTSVQLRNILGLEINGTLCSDKSSCWRGRMKKWGAHDGDYVIGDEVYQK